MKTYNNAKTGFMKLRPFQSPDVFSPYEYLLNTGQKAYAEIVNDRQSKMPDLSQYDKALAAKAGELTKGEFDHLNNDLTAVKSKMMSGLSKYNNNPDLYFSSPEGMEDMNKLNSWYGNLNRGLRTRKDLDINTERTKEFSGDVAISNGQGVLDKYGNPVPISTWNTMQEEDYNSNWGPRQFQLEGMSMKDSNAILDKSYSDMLTYSWDTKVKGIDPRNSMLDMGQVAALSNISSDQLSDDKKLWAIQTAYGTKNWDNSVHWEHANQYANNMVNFDPNLRAKMLSMWYYSKDRSDTMNELIKNNPGTSVYKLDQMAREKTFETFTTNWLLTHGGKYLNVKGVNTGTQFEYTPIGAKEEETKSIGGLGAFELNEITGIPEWKDTFVSGEKTKYKYGLTPGAKYSRADILRHLKQQSIAVDKSKLSGISLTSEIEAQFATTDADYDKIIESYFTIDNSGMYVAKNNIPYESNGTALYKRPVLFETLPSQAQSDMMTRGLTNLQGKTLSQLRIPYFIRNGVLQYVDPYDGKTTLQSENIANAKIVSIEEVMKGPNATVLGANKKQYDKMLYDIATQKFFVKDPATGQEVPYTPKDAYGGYAQMYYSVTVEAPVGTAAKVKDIKGQKVDNTRMLDQKLRSLKWTNEKYKNTLTPEEKQYVYETEGSIGELEDYTIVEKKNEVGEKVELEQFTIMVPIDQAVLYDKDEAKSYMKRINQIKQGAVKSEQKEQNAIQQRMNSATMN